MVIPTSFFYVKLFCTFDIHRYKTFDRFIPNALSSDKRTGVLCLIFELMTMNLYEYIRGRQRLLPNDTVCRLMYQLFKGLEYLHR